MHMAVRLSSGAWETYKWINSIESIRISLRNHQLPRAPQILVKPHESLSQLAGMLAELISCGYYAGNHSRCEFIIKGNDYHV